MNKVTPKRFSINKSDRTTYKKLKKLGPFKGQHNSCIFVVAVALGFFKAKNGIELDDPDQFLHDHNLTERQKSIIKAVAVHKENNLEVLANQDKVVKIANEYANAGLPLIESMVNEHDPDFITSLEDKMVDYFDTEKMGKI
ncbi:MAG: hypothetical protein U1C19_00025 [Methanobacteriaceae archaeon]|nr:hypothetical protein [Methanobacteriaceae archaeon]